MSGSNEFDETAIAIIGMAGRFPGARSLDAFWQNLRDGVESITFLTDQELDALGADSTARDHPGYVRAAAVLDDPDLFDAAFFNVQPREAELIDPQHRVFLECAWEALESAGYDSLRYSGAIGVYAGATISSYLLFNLASHHIGKLGNPLENIQIGMGNAGDFLATRVSYKLNLTGPSHAVLTACSTSLVAVHIACQNLLYGECDIALAGGVSVQVNNRAGYLYLREGLASPDGHCRAFDAQAQGTIFGSGVGVVVLKRLDAALADGDQVHAVIRGSAINNDGSAKVGFTAPSVEGQTRVIAEALANADIGAETISYIEAHGTGTLLGDPIEIQALAKAFRTHTDKKGFCAIGSVKTNIGHLDAAAGVTGLIKTVLALKHRALPPSLHFSEPNPRIDFAGSPFYVNAALSEWRTAGFPRRAGVSSFGIGGTNAHVIVEEAPPPAESGPSRPWQLLVLSARSATALETATANLAEHLKRHPDLKLPDVAYTLQVGRRVFAYRRMVVCRQAEDAIQALETGDAQRSASRFQEPGDRTIVFMFPGGGTQYHFMGLGLYRSEPIFRAQIDECAERLKAQLGCDLRDWLYPGEDRAAEAEQRLQRPALALAVLFVTEYALARLWMAWGVQPEALIGHSMGEYVAACLAGVFSLEDALALVALRGQLFEQLPTGAMLSVALPEDHVRPLLDARLSIAAINAPQNCVVSGPLEALDEFAAQLTGQAVQFRRLPVDVAAHSAVVDAILDSFMAFIARVRLHTPQIPFVSNVTGTWITAAEATDPRYWASHLRQTVRFSDGIQLLLQEPNRLLLEVGPGRTLSRLAREHSSSESEAPVLASLRHRHDPRDDMECILDTLGRLWLADMTIDWQGFYARERRRRLSLPTYPFERQRYWVEPLAHAEHSAGVAAQTAAPTNGELPPMPGVTKDMPQPNTAIAVAPPSPARHAQIVARVRTVLSKLSGQDPAELDADTNFFQLGFDSLILVQANHVINETFGVELTVHQLFQDFPSLNTLAAYIDQQLPPEPVAVSPPVGAAAALTLPATAPMAASASATSRAQLTHPGLNSGLEHLLAEQLRVMSQQLDLQRAILSQQLDLLRAHQPPGEGLPAAASMLAAAPARPELSAGLAHQEALLSQQQRGAGPWSNGVKAHAAPSPNSAASSSNGVGGEPGKADAAPFVPYRPLQTHAERLDPRQRSHLEALIDRYTARTQTSKRHIEESRFVRANHRNSMAFRLLWKEMVYPIIAPQGRGARIWDIDGNEYVDLAMGFGVTLLGHAPPFIMAALEQELKHGQGLLIGPYSDKAGQVAQLISELTGVERVAFYNSGTEAVMIALRLARAATGRSKIALFAGSFHGTYDGTLAKPDLFAEGGRSLPLAPGVVPGLVEDVLILNYCNPQSLEIIRAHGHELAAVLVEPVQSRRPDLQPREFLKQLRQLTSEIGAALIFDEMVTGFRFHPGGAQAWFDVQADLVAYGKIAGGGMPIGVVAGKPTFMDGIDGGMWQYGDASYPPHDARRVFVGGTFCEHPLAMAASLAMLTYLKEQGLALYQRLNQRTASLVETLRAYFQEQQVPIRISHYGSIFRFIVPGDLEILFYHLLDKGVYTWEGRTCFLSTAHTDEDIEHVIRAVQESIQEMRAGGFLPDLPPRSGGNQPVGYTSAAPGPRTGVQWQVEAPAPSAPTAPAGTAVSAVETLPLTEEQRRLWFLTQVGDETAPVYNEAVILRMRGSLDLAAMRRSLQRVVDRHEALRTTISPEGDTQEVHAALAIAVPLVDEEHLTLAGGDTPVTGWLEQVIKQPFRMDQAPLLRAYLLKRGELSYDLVVVAHHMAADGWSWSVLLHELATIYSAECQGQPPALPRPTPFRAYMQWQAEQARKPAAAAAKAFWQAQFATCVPLLELPSDHPRPVSKTYAGARVQAFLPADLQQALQELSRRQSCSLFMTFLAAFQALLHRLTGQNDFAIGMPVSGQLAMGAASLIGHCTNVMPVRCQISGDPTFTDYLASVKLRAVDLYQHQNYSFTQLATLSEAGEALAQPPATNVLFNMDRGITLPKLPGLEIEIVPSPILFAKQDLSLNIMEIEGALRLDFDYNTELFEPATCRRWFSSFETLLRGIVEHPTARLSTLPLLSAEERRARLASGRATPQEAAVQPFLHQRFELRAAQTPDKRCVSSEEGTLTYAELNRRANQLAHHLRALGVGPGAEVGIRLAPSWMLAVGLLGTLKAGAAYILVDPETHAVGATGQLPAAATAAWITQASYADISGFQGPIICLDSGWEAIARHGADNPAVEVAAQQPACAIFAFAASQEPDRLRFSFVALARHASALGQALQLDADDCVVVWTPSNSVRVAERLLATLLAGAECVLRSTQLESMTDVLQDLCALSASVVDLPVATWRQLAHTQASETQTAAGQRLKRVILSGGLLLRADVQRFQACGLRQQQLLYAYQPTHVPITIAAGPVPNSPDQAGPFQKVPIAAALDGLQLYLLDPRQQLAPTGVLADLYLGREVMGDGCWVLEDATPNTQHPSPITRLYKTGERGRYLPDDRIEVCGPADREVRLRGYTVRLDDVEAILQQHSAVRDAAVIAWSGADSAADRRLVAYVVQGSGVRSQESGVRSQSPQSPIPNPQSLIPELRSFLLGALPDYAAPSVFVALNEIPRRASGRIDWTLLPPPCWTVDEDVGADFAAPRDAVEATLVQLWTQIFEVKSIGIHDNFFALGGQSLLATRLLSRLRQTFSIHLPLRILFEAPTIAQLAAAIRQRQAEHTSDEPAPPLVRRPRVSNTFPLSFAQQRLWYVDQLGADTSYNVFMAVRLTGPLDRAVLKRSFDEILRRHEVLRTTFADADGQPLQIIGPLEPLPLPLIDLSGLAEQAHEAQVDLLATQEVQRPFDLADGRLLRATLLGLGAEQHVILLTMHHIVSDGWSLDVLLRELTALYQALLAGEPSPLPELPIQYVDFAQWQRQWLQGSHYARQLAYWKQQLGQNPPVLELPIDRPRPALQTFRGAVHRFVLPCDVFEGLKRLTQQENTTLFMTLLAAFQALLYLYSSQDDILVGTPSASRHHIETEGLIGFFVNMLVIRTSISGHPSFRELLGRVRDAVLGAYAHQDMPFEKLVEALLTERDPSRSPLFQVMFLLDTRPVERRIAGLTLRSLVIERSTAKFDLFLSMEDIGEDLRGAFEYNTDLFEATTIMRMADHFETFLRNVVEQPDAKL